MRGKNRRRMSKDVVMIHGLEVHEFETECNAWAKKGYKPVDGTYFYQPDGRGCIILQQWMHVSMFQFHTQKEIPKLMGDYGIKPEAEDQFYSALEKFVDDLFAKSVVKMKANEVMDKVNTDFIQGDNVIFLGDMETVLANAIKRGMIKKEGEFLVYIGPDVIGDPGASRSNIIE